MKKVIIICAFAIMAVSCNKSKIRTCKITLSDGTKIEKPTPQAMTPQEADEYELYLMMGSSYQSAKCK